MAAAAILNIGISWSVIGATKQHYYIGIVARWLGSVVARASDL